MSDAAKKYLTRAAIVAADDLEIDDVHVPEWKDETGAEWVCVQALSGTARSQYQASVIEIGPDGARKLVFEFADLKLAALSLVDRVTREPLFSIEEIDVLGRKSSAPLNRIVEAAQRLSALTPKDVKELTENLKAVPSDDSTSSSPES